MKTNIYLDVQAERLLAYNISLSQVLLFGLEPGLAADLIKVLAPNKSLAPATGRSGDDLIEALRNERIDIIFCSSEPEFCQPLLDAVKSLDRHIPVVVVSAEPEFAQWNEAMEAGASDFCNAPFRPSEIHQILTSHLSASTLAA